jgi:hypothetical protein
MGNLLPVDIQLHSVHRLGLMLLREDICDSLVALYGASSADIGGRKGDNLHEKGDTDAPYMDR